MDAVSQPTLGHATLSTARNPYVAPTLTVLGDVRSLTESGSVFGMEGDGMGRFCTTMNPQFNMC